MNTNATTQIVTVTTNDLKGYVKTNKPLSIMEVAELTVYDFNIKPAVRNGAKFIVFSGLFSEKKILKGIA